MGTLRFWGDMLAWIFTSVAYGLFCGSLFTGLFAVVFGITPIQWTVG